MRFKREFAVASCLLFVSLAALSSLALAGSPIGSYTVWLGAMGNTLFFIAQPTSSMPAGSAALFKSDGTTAGTTQVAPIDGVGVLTYKAGTLLISAGTKSYFLANTTAAGQQVWVTDGTSAGTHQVADPYTGQDSQSPTLLGLVGTDLIFAEDTSANTMQLFRTDGTAAGTSALSSFAQNQYGLVSDGIAINGKVFVALESNLVCCQPDLWATDGTSSGTLRIDSNEIGKYVGPGRRSVGHDDSVISSVIDRVIAVGTNNA